MRLQVWSDYACPYCYIGKRHLEEALADFEHAQSVEIVFKAFELNPAASRAVVDTTQQRIEYKDRKTPAAAREMIEHITKMGAHAGLAMNYDTVRYTNTFDAHRLTKLAESKGLGSAMTERLFRAYFTENRELADPATLVSIATDVSLDNAEVSHMLASDTFADAVRAEESEAGRLGIHGVPFFAFDGEMGLSGAHSKATLLKALRESYERFGASTLDASASCAASGCIVPAQIS